MSNWNHTLLDVLNYGRLFFSVLFVLLSTLLFVIAPEALKSLRWLAPTRRIPGSRLRMLVFVDGAIAFLALAFFLAQWLLAATIQPVAPAQFPAMTRVVLSLGAAGDSAREAGDFTKALLRYEEARRAALASSDVVGQASALRALASVRGLQGNFSDALAAYRQAIALSRRVGDMPGVAEGHLGAASIASRIADYMAANADYDSALHVYTVINDAIGQGTAHVGLGNVAADLGDLAAAQAHLERARAIFRRERVQISRTEQRSALFVASARREAVALMNLGNVLSTAGQYDQARGSYQEALKLFQDQGDEHSAGRAAFNLGTTELDGRDFERARSSYEQALDHYRAVGDSIGMADSFMGLAHVAAARQQLTTAAALYAAAESAYSRHGAAFGEAEAMAALADISQRLGNVARARAYARAAQAAYRALGYHPGLTDMAIHSALLAVPLDGSREATIAEAKQMLTALNATVSRVGIDYVSGRMSDSLEVTIFVGTYGKRNCYGVRHGSPLPGRPYFGSNETYFELCKPQSIGAPDGPS